MYNFSGIIYRIWGVCGIVLILGIVCILFKRPWEKNFKLKKCKLELGIIVFAICMSLVYISRVAFPNISSYTGEFVSTNRNSRVAPPLPLTSEYVFWNGEGKKQVFYLDTLSKKEIIPYELETGKEYIIYFDDFTNVIVKIEAIEQDEYVDPYGQSALAALSWWTSTVGAIAAAEPTLFGEVLLGIGVAVLVIPATIEMVSSAVSDSSKEEEAPKSVTEEGNKDSSTESNDKSNSLPTTGEPNSDQHLYDENGLKQTRHYGPDGEAEYDIDYRHPGKNHHFPHKHVWDWSKPNPRGPENDIYNNM